MSGARAGRVLALRALGLGDLLTAVPALRALRRAYPEHGIALAAPAWLAEAVTATGAVDELVPVGGAGRAVPERVPWSGRAPTVAVDLHGNGPESFAVLCALRPGRVFGYADGGGPRWVADEHERARWCRLVEWYGVPADPSDLRIAPPEGVRSPAPGAVVLHPGADAGARRWPGARFGEVGRALVDAGERVVVTGGPDEGDLAASVAEAAGLPPSAVLAGPAALPFPRLAALVAGARAVVVGDTGVSHLATALGTPSVTLFGPVSPALWGPPPDPRHIALWHGPPSGDPHAPAPDARLLGIHPNEVIAALARAFPLRGARSPAGS
ncbi:glycosyltransferase family 9 protein [Streptomyces radicis]|uniref:Glycosyltransferase family 9 protein n=1 Tax=Streptomyces radicis TaxID=1750517 RepID=A0A3A9VY64_9ACTN|nr:glycosyltransferase family 9 protein [Streptomyces radicis]RKN05679.1 glycosyltransferase family 9 protein [Streptomyces radicis]RKN17518.1 glycosyltransferase family 9 protein [Streptomyces radicis]